jgi:hypothetical protein
MSVDKMTQHLCFHIQMIELLSFKWTNFHFSFNSFQRVSPKTRKLTLKKRGKKLDRKLVSIQNKKSWVFSNKKVRTKVWKIFLYFIEYNAHTSIVRTWISQWFLAKKIYFYFSRIISKEIIIASLFIINPFSATFHV